MLKRANFQQFLTLDFYHFFSSFGFYWWFPVLKFSNSLGSVLFQVLGSGQILGLGRVGTKNE